MGKLRLLATVLAFGGLVACGGGERTDGVVGDDAGADLVGRRCGGIAGLPCGRGEYCDPGPGQCQVADAMGVCKRKPYVCPYIYSPVCGCDGETYANSCAAAAAGEPLDHTGACVPPEKVCGGIAGLTCDAGQYCEYAAGQCTVPDATGLCKPVPQACTDVYDPVCGCDGKTYPNACAAAAASVSVAAQGECAPVVKRCGGIAGLACDAGQYCAYEVGQCLVPDAMGVCTPPPDICPSLYDPVCGCDGKTYANSCVAAVSGVSVASKGACAPTPQQCGGLAGLRCPSGQFCALPAGQCKVADAMGTCEPIPGACITLWSPVCGCDGRTYGNFCDAAAASMNVDHAGVCTSLQ